MHYVEGSESSQQGGTNGSHWTRVGSCNVRRDREIEVLFSELCQWRQLSVGSDRRAALRLHCGGHCTKNGRAMWRIFLDHSETQVGHESKIAEVGFCEGWTSLCDWLLEAQVDHEVDWPSACTTLKLLWQEPCRLRESEFVLTLCRALLCQLAPACSSSKKLVPFSVSRSPGILCTRSTLLPACPFFLPHLGLPHVAFTIFQKSLTDTLALSIFLSISCAYCLFHISYIDTCWHQHTTPFDVSFPPFSYPRKSTFLLVSA